MVSVGSDGGKKGSRGVIKTTKIPEEKKKEVTQSEEKRGRAHQGRHQSNTGRSPLRRGSLRPQGKEKGRKRQLTAQAVIGRQKKETNPSV